MWRLYGFKNGVPSSSSPAFSTFASSSSSSPSSCFSPSFAPFLLLLYHAAHFNLNGRQIKAEPSAARSCVLMLLHCKKYDILLLSKPAESQELQAS